MIFLAIALIALVVAVWPQRISLLGRVLGIIVGAWCLVYGAAVTFHHVPAGIGALARFIDLEPEPLGATSVTAVLALAAVVVAAFSYNASARSLHFGALDVKLPNWLAYGTLFLAAATALSVAFTLGLATFVSYSGYGSIKDLYSVYDDNVIGRIAAAVFRLITLPLIVFAVLRLNKRDFGYLILCCPVIVFAVAVGLAEASRITSVYFGALALSFVLGGKRITALICGMMAFASVAYAIEARGHQELGLRYVGQYAKLGLTGDGALEEALTNVATGLVVTSATVRTGLPDNYSDQFKMLSFSPTIDAIDGFQIAKAGSEQRMLWYLPFNAFGEAWLFGPGYMVLFWAIIFGGVIAVNSSMKYGPLPFTVLMCIFCLGIAIASQYPARNALRVLYLVLIARVMLPFGLNLLAQLRSARRRRSSYRDPAGVRAR